MPSRSLVCRTRAHSSSVKRTVVSCTNECPGGRVLVGLEGGVPEGRVLASTLHLQLTLDREQPPVVGCSDDVAGAPPKRCAQRSVKWWTSLAAATRAPDSRRGFGFSRSTNMPRSALDSSELTEAMRHQQDTPTGLKRARHRVPRHLRRSFDLAARRAEWVRRHADCIYGFDVREHVRVHPPVATLESVSSALACLGRREAVTPAGAGYVVWLAAFDPEGLARLFRDGKRVDQVSGTFEQCWDRGFRAIERAHENARDRARERPTGQRPLGVVRRRICGARRGRAARPARRAGRASSSRDGGGSDDSEPGRARLDLSIGGVRR
jgi:hypothetical protein